MNLNDIDLTTDEFKQKIENGNNHILIDVRTPLEFKGGHIPDSINIDINSKEFVEKISVLDKSKVFLLYCRSGHRSYYAAEYMKNNGFNEVYHLEPGIIGWDYEIET